MEPDSAWISMMAERVADAEDVLTGSGVFTHRAAGRAGAPTDVRSDCAAATGVHHAGARLRGLGGAAMSDHDSNTGASCARCRHWTPFEPVGEDVRSMCINKAAVPHNRLGLCRRILCVREYKGDWDEASGTFGPVKNTLAAVEDLSGVCGLRTAASFGCVLWEEE